MEELGVDKYRSINVKNIYIYIYIYIYMETVRYGENQRKYELI
jgi:hypothetical protein